MKGRGGGGTPCSVVFSGTITVRISQYISMIRVPLRCGTLYDVAHRRDYRAAGSGVQSEACSRCRAVRSDPSPCLFGSHSCFEVKAVRCSAPSKSSRMPTRTLLPRQNFQEQSAASTRQVWCAASSIVTIQAVSYRDNDKNRGTKEESNSSMLISRCNH